MSEELNTAIDNDVMIVRFTRPEIRSPLSMTVLAQLHQIVDGCAVNNTLLTVIFTGTGETFASGADLREIAALKSDAAPDFARRGQQLMAKIAALPQMTIAAINGFCFGGALDLALSCDKRIASPNAKFAHPGAGLGIITGWAGTQRLPRLVGRGNALEMFFTAEAISADRAFEIGLIDLIAEDALAESLALTEAVVSS